MLSRSPDASWDFDSAISLLRSVQTSDAPPNEPPSLETSCSKRSDDSITVGSGLGDFSSLWDFFGHPHSKTQGGARDVVKLEVNDRTVAEVDTSQLAKGVRWRDELDGADLEDNAEPVRVSAANLRTQKRAARRARARERAKDLYPKSLDGDTQTDSAEDIESDEELESVRRSPDRRLVIADILGRRPPGLRETTSPPTSPSPPKTDIKPTKKDWPVSNPFLWTAPGVPSPANRHSIAPRDGLTTKQRKSKLITKLLQHFPDEKKYLSNSGLTEPAFTPLNISPIGVHVFIDMSNISIGFHDCLKVIRDIPVSVRVRRVPLNFHNFSLVLERGRPAAKRVLVGSDRPPYVTTAKSLGYETNILERVHKAKELTPRQKKFANRTNGGNTSASGIGETSGSETNTGYHSSGNMALGFQPSKWVEQAVDEILHLKILESLIDADKPSTIVLATGDAAQAEYSDGFMRMVERALEKGWVVELVSFRMNTSSAYMRREFRNKWGSMFKWVCLDDFAEALIDEPETEGNPTAGFV